jgi:hypothetical protein
MNNSSNSNNNCYLLFDSYHFQLGVTIGENVLANQSIFADNVFIRENCRISRYVQYVSDVVSVL